MYCQNCGNELKNEMYCPLCGTACNSGYNRAPLHNNVMPDDRPNAVFAFLGFFFPIVGLILFIIYESKSPKKAKSAGKGALISVAVRLVIAIVYLIFVFGIGVFSFKSIKDAVDDVLAASSYSNETSDDASDDVEVTFGKYVVEYNGYYDESSVQVKIKNLSDKKHTFFITIEAVDENGVRLGTDTVYAYELKPNQETYDEAFKFVEEDEKDAYRHAEFKVLEVIRY